MRGPAFLKPLSKYNDKNSRLLDEWISGYIHDSKLLISFIIKRLQTPS